MSKLPSILVVLCVVLLPRPAQGETVYEFVSACREQKLSACFTRIDRHLTRLNTGADRRICLPRAFGAVLLEDEGVPVSVLEHVRLALSAARFGDAGSEVDDVMVRIVGGLYPCS